MIISALPMFHRHRSLPFSHTSSTAFLHLQWPILPTQHHTQLLELPPIHTRSCRYRTQTTYSGNQFSSSPNHSYIIDLHQPHQHRQYTSYTIDCLRCIFHTSQAPNCLNYTHETEAKRHQWRTAQSEDTQVVRWIEKSKISYYYCHTKMKNESAIITKFHDNKCCEKRMA